MVSLYDSFMFPSAHHHAAHHAGVVGGMGQAQGPHPHHPILTRQPVPPGGASSNLHHAPQPHPHPHHHQMAPNHQYFGYSHAHHWAGGPNAGAQGHHAAAAAAAAIQYPNAMMVEHQQQFVSGLVSADGPSSWHPTPYPAGLPSVSPRTPAYDQEWADNSPNNNNNATTGGVSSPDGSPFGQPSNNGASSPDQQQINYPYGKIFSSSGEFLSPHNLHHQQQADVQRMNASGVVVAGHHSPDSGLAGSDGLSSAGSPAQQQQGMLGSSAGNLLGIPQNPQQQAQQQQQQQQTAPNGPMTPQHGQQLAAAAAAAASGMISRPQPSRSPFEWMKKPAYQSNPNPVFDGLSAGKTRTKDKYRVVYTDNQRLELEKEFHYSRYITIRRKSELANVLGLSERQVKIWFQNRRAKERKQVKKREEMLHKDKIEVVPSLSAVQQQQQQQIHAGQVPQHMQHMNAQHLSAPQISSAMQQHIQMDAKASLGLD